MNLHPFQRRREQNASEKAKEIAQRLSAEIIDHLSENGDIELRLPIGQAPRKISPDHFLSLIAGHSAMTLLDRAPRFAGRLAYDSDASQMASTHRENIGQWDWEHAINESGLTMVYRPAHEVVATEAA